MLRLGNSTVTCDVESGLQKNPDIWVFHVFLIVCLVQLGQMEQARMLGQRLIERYQKFATSNWNSMSSDLPKTALMEGAMRKADFLD